MEIKRFMEIFSIEAFQFSKFHETEAKKDKCNFKKGLTWHSGPKIRKTTEKISLKFTLA